MQEGTDVFARRANSGAIAGVLVPQQVDTVRAKAAGAAVRRTLDRLGLVVAGTALGLILHFYVVDIAVVQGDSMAPSLRKGDYLLIEKLTPRLGVVERGDVVILRKPGSRDLLVKRVVATQGESVRAAFGRVYVNGEPLDERTYTVMSPAYFFDECRVDQREVFVLGDNRHDSDDSAEWGPVPIERVVGRCVAGPLPFGRHDEQAPAQYVRGAQPDTSVSRQALRTGPLRLPSWMEQ